MSIITDIDDKYAHYNPSKVKGFIDALMLQKESWKEVRDNVYRETGEYLKRVTGYSLFAKECQQSQENYNSIFERIINEYDELNEDINSAKQNLEQYNNEDNSIRRNRNADIDASDVIEDSLNILKTTVSTAIAGFSITPLNIIDGYATTMVSGYFPSLSGTVRSVIRPGYSFITGGRDYDRDSLNYCGENAYRVGYYASLGVLALFSGGSRAWSAVDASETPTRRFDRIREEIQNEERDANELNNKVSLDGDRFSIKNHNSIDNTTSESSDSSSNSSSNNSSSNSGNSNSNSYNYDWNSNNSYDNRVVPDNTSLPESKPGNIYNGDSKPVAPEQEIPNNVEPTPYTPPADNGSNYYWSGGESSTQEVVPEVPKEEPVIEQVDEIVGGNKYTKIPTATISKVATTTTTKSGNSVIPVLAGISAAAAAGIGAKAYMDRKKNSDNSDSDIEVSEWSEEYTDSDADNTPVESYSATSKNNSFVENDENSLSEDNSYEELEPAAEKYDARSNDNDIYSE